MSQLGRPVNTPSNRREVFSERSRSMHSFARHFHSEASEASAKETKGLILNGGWRYDLGIWFIDIFAFCGQLRELRQRTANLARMQPGEQVLDVGCGPGPLESGPAPRAHRFPDWGDRATLLPRSDVRCGVLYPDDASFACEPQTSGTR